MERSEGGDAMEENKTVLTVLHCGDVLLDAPTPRLRKDGAERRREELRDAFSAFLSRVDEERADLVVFSGNLLSAEYATDETLVFLANAFSERPWCHFVIAPGPRDPYDGQSIYRSRRFSRNVHVFAEEVLGSYAFPELPLSVYGWGFRSDRLDHAPLTGAHRHGSDRFSVLCGYTDLAGEDGVCPLTEEALVGFGAHYTALCGRPHDGFHRVGGGVYAFCGAFEGHAFGEGRTGGYIRIRAEQEDGGWSVDAEYVPIDTYRYEDVLLDVSHLTDVRDVAERLLARVKQEGYGKKTALRVVLCGSVAPEVEFSGLDTAADYGVYALTVCDHTVPTDGAERLLQEMNARGELYRHFYPAMTEGSDEERARAARTFRIGYAALLGKDFTRY